MTERDIEALATELNVEITATTQLGDSVVTLASVSPGSPSGSYESVGASHPWAAPIASVFAAWAPEPKRHAWEEASRHLTGSVDRKLLEELLRGVRERGYAVAGDRAMTERFLQLTQGSQADRDSYAQIWAEIAAGRARLETEEGVAWNEVAVVQVPVFDADGDVALGLYAIGPSGLADQKSVERLVSGYV